MKGLVDVLGKQISTALFKHLEVFSRGELAVKQWASAGAEKELCCCFSGVSHRLLLCHRLDCVRPPGSVNSKSSIYFYY